jgi:hypothetical protein
MLENPKVYRSLGRTKCRWKAKNTINIIKIDIEDMNWVEQAQQYRPMPGFVM